MSPPHTHRRKEWDSAHAPHEPPGRDMGAVSSHILPAAPGTTHPQGTAGPPDPTRTRESPRGDLTHCSLEPSCPGSLVQTCLWVRPHLAPSANAQAPPCLPAAS